MKNFSSYFNDIWLFKIEFEKKSQFNSWFIFSTSSHRYETSFAIKSHLKIPTVTTTTYSKGTFIGMATEIWINIQSQVKDPMINSFCPNKPKRFFFDFYLNLYQTKVLVAF